MCLRVLDRLKDEERYKARKILSKVAVCAYLKVALTVFGPIGFLASLKAGVPLIAFIHLVVIKLILGMTLIVIVGFEWWEKISCGSLPMKVLMGIGISI